MLLGAFRWQQYGGGAKWQEMEETRVFLETQVAQSRFAKQQEATRADGLAAQVRCHAAKTSPILQHCTCMLEVCCWTALPLCLCAAIRPKVVCHFSTHAYRMNVKQDLHAIL